MTLAFEDGFELGGFGTINLTPHFTFRMQNCRSFKSFTLRLQLHTPLDLIWWFDVFDFVSEAVNTPFLTRLIKCRLNICIETISFLESSIKI